MKSLFEELGSTYTLGKDGMYYPNLAIEKTDQRSIGKWGRMHREYLKEQHPSLYQRLIKRIFGQASCPCRRKSDSNARKTDRADG